MPKIKKQFNFKNAKYVDIRKNWRKLGPIFNSRAAYRVWLPCMKNYAWQRSEAIGGKFHVAKLTYPNAKPSDYDSCDWRVCNAKGESRRGRSPIFWDFACHSACHWLVDLNLYVAKIAYPKIPWRILTNDSHSTVWNGDYLAPVLFDVNFTALKVSPIEALQMVCRGTELKPGQYYNSHILNNKI